MKKIILILLLALLATACEQDLYTNHIHKRNEKKVSITEGVWGTVFLRTGDLLPCVHISEQAPPIRVDKIVF